MQNVPIPRAGHCIAVLLGPRVDCHVMIYEDLKLKTRHREHRVDFELTDSNHCMRRKLRATCVRFREANWANSPSELFIHSRQVPMVTCMLAVNCIEQLAVQEGGRFCLSCTRLVSCQWLLGCLPMFVCLFNCLFNWPCLLESWFLVIVFWQT